MYVIRGGDGVSGEKVRLWQPERGMTETAFATSLDWGLRSSQIFHLQACVITRNSS